MSEQLYVTPDMVQEFMESVEYFNLTDITTVCVIKLKNGMEAVGVAQRQSVNAGSREVGKTVANSHAFRSAYELTIAHYRAS